MIPEDHTPEGGITYLVLIQMVVEGRYGISMCHKRPLQKPGEFVTLSLSERAEARLSRLDIERWHDAREIVLTACRNGNLIGYICNDLGRPFEIHHACWDMSIMGKYGPRIEWDRFEPKTDPYMWHENSKCMEGKRIVAYFNNYNVIEFLDTLGSKTEIKPHEQSKNKGGNPSVDPKGIIFRKIQELKSKGIKSEDIPWDINFTRFVQKLKSDKINGEYKNNKVPPRIKGKEYTKFVGISLDTVKKLIKKTPK